MKLLLEISATTTAKNKLQKCIHSFMEQFTGSTLDESEANAFMDSLSSKIKEFNEAHKKCTPAEVNTWCITDKLCFGVQA